MDLEDYLIIIIAAIMIYIIVSLLFGLDTQKAILTTYASTQLGSKPISGGNELLNNKLPERLDNLETPIIDPFGTNHKISKTAKKSYDEYDDTDLLKELDINMMESFDNIVIDGYNFIYSMNNALLNSKKLISSKDHLDYIRKAVKLIVKHFPKKNIYFVFKDTENEEQEKDLIREMQAKNIRDAYKKFFTPITKEHTKVRFVLVYGDAKYRDDYAAIWLADVLPDNTILLSRDRYRDVQDMVSTELQFITYGKQANKINKIINKPFNYVTKGAVKATLVGYSFSKKIKSGFYNKDINYKSSASDLVYIFKV